MRAAYIMISFLFSFTVMAGQRLDFTDTTKVPLVVLGDEILLQNLTQLYSDYYFEDRMIAGKTEKVSKKSKKPSWTDNLRNRLNGHTGIYRI